MLVDALFVEACWSDVSESVAHGIIAADFDNVTVIDSKAKLSEYLVGVANYDKSAAKELI